MPAEALSCDRASSTGRFVHVCAPVPLCKYSLRDNNEAGDLVTGEDLGREVQEQREVSWWGISFKQLTAHQVCFGGIMLCGEGCLSLSCAYVRVHVQCLTTPSCTRGFWGLHPMGSARILDSTSNQGPGGHGGDAQGRARHS